MNFSLSPKWTLIYILIGSVIFDIAYGILDFVELGSLQIALAFRDDPDQFILAGIVSSY